MTDTCEYCGKESENLEQGHCPICFSDFFIYCEVCDRDYHEDELCHHVFWNHEAGWWDGPGHSAENPDSCKESLVAMIAHLGIANAMKNSMESGAFQVLKNGDYFDVWSFNLTLNGQFHKAPYEVCHEERFINGLEWLWRLEPFVTIDAIQRTIGWIDEYLKGKK